MEQLGWSETTAIVRVGLAFTVGGLYAGVIFASLGSLAKRYNERFLVHVSNSLLIILYGFRIGERTILIIGIVFFILAPVALFPYEGPLPPFKNTRNNTNVYTGTWAHNLK